MRSTADKSAAPLPVQIQQVFQNPTAAPEIGYDDYLRFRDLILKQSGLYFPEKKRDDLEYGLLKALAESPLAPAEDSYDLDAYYNRLSDKNDPIGRIEMERLINILTVGETYFFRNKAQFDALATHVLPELIARNRAVAEARSPDTQPQLRIWSAGCATGEEPYSVAILLKELLPDLAQWRILILATDINQDSLNRARRATYSNWSFREPWAKAVRPLYFNRDPVTRRHHLRSDIQHMVTFANLNLIEDTYPTLHNNTISMDLILCRNVTIYFTEADTRKVTKKFFKTLVKGGWLVVGHAEPSFEIYRAFETRNFPSALLYQKDNQSQFWFDQEQDDREPESPQAAAEPRTLSFWPTPAEVVKPAEVDSYQAAIVLLNDGQIEDAIEALHHKLDAAPDFAPAHCLLGRAYANLGCWDQARRWCTSALELDSLLAEAYYVLALVYDQEQAIQSAINSLKKAIYLERDIPLFHLNLAMLYIKTNQVRSAQRACRNAIKILEQWPPTDIVPDTGGATVQHLLETTRRISNELESGDDQ